MSDATSSRSPGESSGRRRALTGALSWLLAPVLATGAIAAQLYFDVPTGEVIPRDDPKKPKPRSHPPKTKETRNKSWEGRPAPRLAIMRESWANQDIADEPIDQAFRQHHESLLRSAVSIARRQIIGTELVSLQARPTCHLIRCELELCGPAEPVQTVGDALVEIRRDSKQDGVGPLWLELREVEPTRQPEGAPSAPPDSPDGPLAPKDDAQRCRRWVVSFTADDVARGEVIWGGAHIEPAPEPKPKPGSKPKPKPKPG